MTRLKVTRRPANNGEIDDWLERERKRIGLGAESDRRGLDQRLLLLRE